MRISDWSSDVCSSDLRDTAVGRLADALEGQRIGGFAVDVQRHRLPGRVLDRGADRLGARIMVAFGNEPADARRLTREPVAARACGFGIAPNLGRPYRDSFRRGERRALEIGRAHV